MREVARVPSVTEKKILWKIAFFRAGKKEPGER